MKQCQKCGMLVNDNSSFCEYCGSNVSATGMESFQVPRSPVPSPRKGSHIKDKSLVAALVVLVVAAVIFASACASTLMSNQPSSSSSSSDSSSSTSNSGTTNGGTTNTDTTSDGTSDAGTTNNGDTSASTTNGGTANNDGSGGSTSQTDNAYYHKCGYNYYIEYTDKFYDGYSDDLTYEYPGNSNYIFAIVTIKLVNNGYVSISTNPFSWDYQLNGVNYEHSSVSYSKLFNQQTVTVNEGGTGTTEQVYEVPNIETGATIVCVDPWVSDKPDYAYRDSSISVTVPMTVASPTLSSVDNGKTIIGRSTDIPLSWNNVPNAGYYEVQSSDVADFSHVQDTKYGTGTQTTDHAYLIFPIGEASGTAYIRVRAFDGWGRAVSDWSNTVSVTIKNTY